MGQGFGFDGPGRSKTQKHRKERNWYRRASDFRDWNLRKYYCYHRCCYFQGAFERKDYKRITKKKRRGCWLLVVVQPQIYYLKGQAGRWRLRGLRGDPKKNSSAGEVQR